MSPCGWGRSRRKQLRLPAGALCVETGGCYKQVARYVGLRRDSGTEIEQRGPKADGFGFGD